MNDELRNSLIEKEREIEAFMKNRDEMVTKYESLVKAQQEELEKQKRGLTKSYSKERDFCENTSEDEVILKVRRARRPPKKHTPSSPKRSEITVMDLPGSDSKRSRKRNNLPPPESVSKKKRNTRKKKLYIGDEFFQDIEPLETTVTITPSMKTRTLRSRRK